MPASAANSQKTKHCFSRKPALTPDSNAASGLHEYVPSLCTGMDICLPHTTMGSCRVCIVSASAHSKWLSNEGVSSLPENPPVIYLMPFDSQMRDRDLAFAAFAQAGTQGQGRAGDHVRGSPILLLLPMPCNPYFFLRRLPLPAPLPTLQGSSCMLRGCPSGPSRTPPLCSHRRTLQVGPCLLIPELAGHFLAGGRRHLLEGAMKQCSLPKPVPCSSQPCH